MNQLEYIPGIGGASIQMDGQGGFVGIAENLRSREWDYGLGYRDLVTATRPAREVDVTFNADYETADELRRVADADVAARTPGTFIAQNEWRQRGYILASQPNDIHYGWLSTELKIALLDGAWWRRVSRSFRAENTTPEYSSATGEIVTAYGASGAPLHSLEVEGKSVQDGTPTLDAPVPVQVVKPTNLVNLLNANSTTTAKSTVVSTGVNTISIQPNSTTATWCHVNQSFNGILTAGERYTLSAKFSGNTNGKKCAIGIRNSDDSGYLVWPSNNQSTDESAELTVSFTADGPNLIIWWYPVNEGTAQASPATVTYYDIQLEKGNTATEFIPGDSIGLNVGDTVTLIDLQDNTLASLPDGTKDVLTVDSAGHCEIEKHTGYIASYNGESVGDNYISTTGELSTGASIYYKLATAQTIDLGDIDMPSVPNEAVISIAAAVTPTITAEWQTSKDAYLDYPCNYEYDYSERSTVAGIESSVLTPSDVHLVVYGPAVNPYVIVGDNRYQVNVTVPSGGYLTIDGRDKTIVLTLIDGSTQNVFAAGIRGSGQGGGQYIFEPVPAGLQEVAWDGSFGFDFGWYEEEGEPPWSQF